MANTTENIAALIGSRICHDLISPIGAVNNGLELLALGGSGGTPEMALVADSAASASARIRLFRLAFGVAQADQTTTAEELCRTWDDAQAGKPLKLVWSGPDGLPRRDAQALLLGCLCAELALPRGGDIRISHRGGSWCLEAQGTPFAYDQPLWACLSGARPQHDIAPAKVQFVLLPRLLAETGRQAQVEHLGNRLRLIF